MTADHIHTRLPYSAKIGRLKRVTSVSTATSFTIETRSGFSFEPYGHLRYQWSKRPHEPFPLAIVLGADPVVPMAAVAPVPYGRDELAVAGALRGKPIEMVRCVTIPLEVPASADIVIEGEILLNDLRDEGPFGEFTGYYGGHRAPARSSASRRLRVVIVRFFTPSMKDSRRPVRRSS